MDRALFEAALQRDGDEIAGREGATYVAGRGMPA